MQLARFLRGEKSPSKAPLFGVFRNLFDLRRSTKDVNFASLPSLEYRLKDVKVAEDFCAGVFEEGRVIFGD